MNRDEKRDAFWRRRLGDAVSALAGCAVVEAVAYFGAGVRGPMLAALPPACMAASMLVQPAGRWASRPRPAALERNRRYAAKGEQ